ncbi:MAG: DUF4238 domain-containing protein [Spirochaetota bacterium]|nr:DUF4238 domain-containing protein [Spirochaetota bacterium]
MTKKQHYVPQFYLESWAIHKNNSLYRYDLEIKKSKLMSPKEILWENFYYEEDQDNPDNRIEKMLGDIENLAASIVKQINEITNKHKGWKNKDLLRKELENYLTEDRQKIIKDFAVYQYLRVPEAIEQKRYELQNSDIPNELKEYNLNPGRFTESGYSYIRNNFDNLKMLVFCSFESYFLTCDWPCFDMRDDKEENLDAPFFDPILGEEIGKKEDVFALFPLTPRVSILFIHKDFNNNSIKIPNCSIHFSDCSDVKNRNEMIIKKAKKYVVSIEKNDDFIFETAKKRKRETNPELFN